MGWVGVWTPPSYKALGTGFDETQRSYWATINFRVGCRPTLLNPAGSLVEGMREMWDEKYEGFKQDEKMAAESVKG